MDWNFIIDNLIHENISEFLNFVEVINLIKVSKLFYEGFNQDRIWREKAKTIFKTKLYVPDICQRILKRNSKKGNYNKKCKISDLKYIIKEHLGYDPNYSEKYEYLNEIEKIEFKIFTK